MVVRINQFIQRYRAPMLELQTMRVLEDIGPSRSFIVFVKVSSVVIHPEVEGLRIRAPMVCRLGWRMQQLRAPMLDLQTLRVLADVGQSRSFTVNTMVPLVMEEARDFPKHTLSRKSAKGRVPSSVSTPMDDSLVMDWVYRGVPLDRYIDFVIELKLGSNPISVYDYRMGLAKLKELKEQLEDLLNKWFIRPSVSPRDALITYQDKATQTEKENTIEDILKVITTLCIKVDSMDNEIQKLKSKAISQSHDYKHVEICQSEDTKHPELEGDVGILQKTHNDCFNAAAGVSDFEKLGVSGFEKERVSGFEKLWVSSFEKEDFSGFEKEGVYIFEELGIWGLEKKRFSSFEKLGVSGFEKLGVLGFVKLGVLGFEKLGVSVFKKEGVSVFEKLGVSGFDNEGVLGFEKLGVEGFEKLGVSSFVKLGVSGFEKLGVSGFKKLGVSGFEKLGVSGFEKAGVLGFEKLGLWLREGRGLGI
ncbi:hypothetical protein MTR67_040489 [Solanum verrucosum]|uniref:Uncharacterized protein n=1 Tax=Solanum verrucosum TaxID=315347 RepID=A0AAF0ZS59_SOLVR|nr:hypothetical protein MTR67_040489 [Solanum verrucosum]